MTDREAMKMAFDLLCDAVEPTATQIQADIGMCSQWDVDAIECIDTLRQALAQPEQEPINKMPTKIFGPNLEEILNAAGFYRQPEQKPVAWLYNGHLHECDPSDWAESEVKPLYTAPVSKPWVSLTDEEILEAFCNTPGFRQLVSAFKAGALWAEAALRSKNNG